MLGSCIADALEERLVPLCFITGIIIMNAPYHFIKTFHSPFSAVNRINDLQEILSKMKQLVEHGYHGNFLDVLKKGTFAESVGFAYSFSCLLSFHCCSADCRND